MKEYRFKINGKEFTSSVDAFRDGIATVTVNGRTYSVEMEKDVTAAAEGTAAPTAMPTPVSVSAGHGTVLSPLPGVITGIFADKGEAVKKGQRIAVLEAMKMENDILAPCDGTLVSIFVHKGDSVLEGAKIASIG